MTGDGTFPYFRLSEDHEAIREAVRAVASDKIAPYAAEVDDRGVPNRGFRRSPATDFHAPHIPVEYAGVGADALATCIIIEEIARFCASSSLIPAVNKLGTLPLILAGSEALKRRYLPPVARGDALFSYCLSEREAGSDTASIKCRAIPDGDDWILTGQKSWISNAGVSEFYTVITVTDPDGRRGSNSTAFVVEKSDAGVSFGRPEKKLGVRGSPTREVLFDHVRLPGDRMVGYLGEGLKIALRTLDHTRVTIGAQAVGIAQGALDSALESSGSGSSLAGISPTSRVCSSCSPTWRSPWRPPQPCTRRRPGREHDDPDLSFFGATAKCSASDAAMRITTDAVQLLGGCGYTQDFSGGAHDPRRRDHPDLRGHQPDPTGSGRKKPSAIRWGCPTPPGAARSATPPWCGSAVGNDDISRAEFTDGPVGQE